MTLTASMIILALVLVLAPIATLAFRSIRARSFVNIVGEEVLAEKNDKWKRLYDRASAEAAASAIFFSKLGHMRVKFTLRRSFWVSI